MKSRVSLQEQNFPGVLQSPTQSITLLVKRKRGFKHKSKIFHFKYRKGLNELFVTTPILRESCYFSKAAFDKSEAKSTNLRWVALQWENWLSEWCKARSQVIRPKRPPKLHTRDKNTHSVLFRRADCQSCDRCEQPGRDGSGSLGGCDGEPGLEGFHVAPGFAQSLKVCSLLIVPQSWLSKYYLVALIPWETRLQGYSCGTKDTIKHRKNCECCPVSQLIVR